MKPFYLTTAIDYANGAPHLGHAYEKVLADVIARHHRLKGEAVHFLTGLDEHGQKVQATARREGIEPQAYVDGIAPLFLDLCRQLHISYDDFIRTTQPRHKAYVQKILQQLFDAGDIYQAEYRGWYSVRQEQFVLEKDKVDGRWPELYGEVIEIAETNYFFRLAKYQAWLVEHIQAHDDFIFPRFRARDVLEFLKEPINDLCISRPIERLAWGIPLPFDPNYVTYVWFDALLNYASAVGWGADAPVPSAWPADFHIIGKDILVPAHAVYWPIMLRAAGLPLPKSLLVHGWWLRGGRKESKSSGDALNPLDLVAKFGPDAFRYYVIREMNVGQDSEFSVEGYLARYNAELANDLGNLVSRLLNMGHSYVGGVLPVAPAPAAGSPEADLVALWTKTATEVQALYDGLQFHTALDRQFTFVRALNKLLEVRQPWVLWKQGTPEAKATVGATLALIAEGVRLVATTLAPITPALSARLLELLGAPALTVWTPTSLAWGTTLAGARLGPKTILFPRPEKEKA